VTDAPPEDEGEDELEDDAGVAVAAGFGFAL
jgi:hypothetical protein